MANFNKPQPELVDVDGNSISVHPITAGQLAKLLTQIEDLKKQKQEHQADFVLLHLCCKNQDGTSFFASAEEAMDIPPHAAAKLIPVCLRVNGMGDTAKKND